MARDDTLGMEAIEGPVARTTGSGTLVEDELVNELLDELPVEGVARERLSPVLVELHELPLPALRRRHDLLEAELRRVRYWQRLLRARRDLVVAGTVSPDELAVPLEAAAHEGPLEQHLDDAGEDLVTAPGHVLRTLVLPSPAADAPSRLAELVDAETHLAAYAAAVVAEHALASQVLAERRGVLFGVGA